MHTYMHGYIYIHVDIYHVTMVKEKETIKLRMGHRRHMREHSWKDLERGKVGRKAM